MQAIFARHGGSLLGAPYNMQIINNIFILRPYAIVTALYDSTQLTQGGHIIHNVLQ